MYILYIFKRFVKYLYLKIKYNIDTKDVSVGSNFMVTHRECIKFGHKMGISDNVELCVTYNKDILKQKNISKPSLCFGDYVWIGRDCHFGCSYNIHIGNYVTFGPFCHISDRNHGYKDVYTPISLQPENAKKPVIIDDETWIGFGSQIMAGVHIGRHCVIGAGSIVTKDIPDYCVVVGNPARIVKRYDINKKEWIAYGK